MTLQTILVSHMGKSRNESFKGNIHVFFLHVRFRISINNKLGPLKKMMPPLLKKIV